MEQRPAKHLQSSMCDIAIPAIERERAARIAKNREELRKLGLYRSPEKASLPRRKSTTNLTRKNQEPTRKAVPRNCSKQHDNLSESSLAPQLLFSREPELVPTSRFGRVRMGKRKSLSPVDWSPEFHPPDGTESDASELYHLLLPHLKTDAKAQQVAIWLVKQDITRGDLVAASDDEAAAFLQELFAYLKPTFGMEMRLKLAWRGLRSGISIVARHPCCGMDITGILPTFAALALDLE